MKQTVRNQLGKLYEYKIFLLAGILLVGIAIGALSIVHYAQSVTDSLSDEVIRFHVVANSDTVDDQMLKQKVRDEVIAFMEPLIKECDGVEETRYLLTASAPIIEEVAREVIEDWGRDYEVYVTVDRANFPTKAYGDVVFPAGEYEACRVIIGEGKGENWWCVMYPPLCYVDAATGVVPLEGKEQLAAELTADQYELVTNHTSANYQVRFKIVDAINGLFQKENYKSKR